MTRVVPLIEDGQNAAVVAVFQEIQNAFGKVPNLFRAYAHHPPLLRANWDKVKAVMMKGRLRREVKETIALLVSKDNGCDYCVAAHTAALRSLGIEDEQIATLEQSLEAVAFEAKEMALIDLARQANRKPHAVTDAQFHALRETGAQDAEIVEALGVMEVFAAFNRFLDTLQVAIDF
jgi:uncharacterized peroxidase-related enzyme